MIQSSRSHRYLVIKRIRLRKTLCRRALLVPAVGANLSEFFVTYLTPDLKMSSTAFSILHICLDGSAVR